MAITLQTAFDRVELRLGDINNITLPAKLIMGTDLNQFLFRQLFAIDPERLIISVTYSIPASSSTPYTVALPVGFRDVEEYGTGFFVQNTDGSNTTRQLGITGFGSILPGYYIDGTNVVFTGISLATTVILRYIPVLADMTLLSSTFCVPDEFKDLVTEGLVTAYYKFQEDTREADSDQRFARLLEQFLTSVKKGPNVYGLPDPYTGGYNTLYPFSPYNNY